MSDSSESQAPVPAQTAHPDYWRRCSSCKKNIGYGTEYWVCNVSTCNRKRTGLVFCGVSCWDAHLGFANHRESWAEERTAPSRDEWERTLRGEDVKPRKPRETKAAEEAAPATTAPSAPKVILRRPGGGGS